MGLLWARKGGKKKEQKVSFLWPNVTVDSASVYERIHTRLRSNASALSRLVAHSWLITSLIVSGILGGKMVAGSFKGAIQQS